jgi:hypothetical protein
MMPSLLLNAFPQPVMMNNQFLISYRELRVYQAALDLAMQVFRAIAGIPASRTRIPDSATPADHAPSSACMWLRRG